MKNGIDGSFEREDAQSKPLLFQFENFVQDESLGKSGKHLDDITHSNRKCSSFCGFAHETASAGTSAPLRSCSNSATEVLPRICAARIGRRLKPSRFNRPFRRR